METLTDYGKSYEFVSISKKVATSCLCQLFFPIHLVKNKNNDVLVMLVQ